jgi:uncharacterized protein
MSVMEPAEQAPESTDSIADEPAVPEPDPIPPSIADGVERSLDPRAVALNRTVGWIVAGVIFLVDSGALAIVWAVDGVPVLVKALVGLVWGSVALALVWLAHRWPPIEHRHASYKVDGRGIEIRKGVIWRMVMNVPRSRVQHTDVSQGPLERRYGLGTLVIYTAGTDHARVNLAGLDHGTALEIRDHLLPGEDEDAV